jgi:Skp family chaperone for outer membrane proteins
MRPPESRLRHVRVLVAVLSGLGSSLAGPAAAAINIGYIDSAKIFQEYDKAKEAQALFDRQVQGWRDEAAEKEKAVNQLRAEVRDQAPILSAMKRQEKEESLQRAVSDYERFVQEIWGPQGKAATENERATGSVVGEIRAAVERIAVNKNLNLVLDAAGGFIIYADKNLDLTVEVIQELNARSSTNPK